MLNHFYQVESYVISAPEVHGDSTSR
jgi:hypothetical protein